MIHKKGLVILAVVIALIAIAVMTFFYMQKKSSNSPQNSVPQPSLGTESVIYKKYAAVSGEAYDKAFTANLVIHYGNVLNMAEIAAARAEHQQLKDMAEEIVSTYGLLMYNLNNWQKEWGYPVTAAHNMADMENAGDSMEGMYMMNDELIGLKGDKFDSKYIELMIQTNQEAIDMAQPAATNAKRQEVKDIAAKIVNLQFNEISQMKQWQKEWGMQPVSVGSSSEATINRQR